MDLTAEPVGSRGKGGSAQVRREHDLLGTRDVPAAGYYGIHTLRALENFPISGVPIGRYSALVRGLACVKEAAALANDASGVVEPVVVQAIVLACREIRAGALHEEFVVDTLQGGAGTSTNMNANEVIANRALEILGYPRGRYDVVHPIEHVNRSQSTNDVYPTAAKVALHEASHDLLAALGHLGQAFVERSDKLGDVLKMGRTQLQEAVPMTLRQEFVSFATLVEEEVERLRGALPALCVVNFGGTAIGTGLTAPPAYADDAVESLARITGLPLQPAADRIASTQDTGAFVALSAGLRGVAVKLSKISNDLRLLSSGPRAGFAEISLPAVQAGSSIMPGKVNPVIPEMVNQVAFAVIGRDVTVALAAEGGQLQLNPFEPVIVVSLLESIQQLTHAARLLADRCIAGITCDPRRLRHSVEHSSGLVTALLPHIGYERATVLAARVQAGQSSVVESSVVELLADEGLLPQDWEQQVLGNSDVGPRTPQPVGLSSSDLRPGRP